MNEIKGNITRTFYTCEAVGYAIDGIDKTTGLPSMVEVHSDDYITVNANDMALAKRECKRVNKKVIPDTVSVRILFEEVRAMSLNTFYSMSSEVERGANGRVK